MPKQIHLYHDKRFLAPSEIGTLTISPDGKQLIAYSGDYKKHLLTIFDIESGIPLETIETSCDEYDFTYYKGADQLYFEDEKWLKGGEREYFLNRIQLSPELKVEEIGLRFSGSGYNRDYVFRETEILVGNTNSLLIFDKDSKELKSEIKGPWTENSNGIAISPDAKLVAFGNWESNEIQVFDIASATLIKSFAVGALHDQHGSHISFLPDSKTLYVSANLIIELWDAKTGKKKQAIQVDGIYRCNIIDYTISVDGQYLLAFYTGLHLALFRLSDGEQLWLKTNMDGLHGFCFSADAKTVYYSEGMNIKQFDTLRGEPIGDNEKLGVLPNQIYKLPTEHTLLAFFGKQAMKLDANTGKPLETIFGDRSPNFYYNESDPEAAYNLLCAGDYNVHLFNADTGKNKAVLSKYYGKVGLSSEYIAATDGYLSRERVKKLNIYDLSGKLLHNLAKHQKNTPVYGMRFLPDGLKLFGIGEKFLALWDVEAGTQIWQVPFKKNSYSRIYFDAAGKYIYLYNSKQVLFCIDSTNGNSVWEYNFPEKKSENVITALFSVGKELLILGKNGDIRLLNAETGKELKKEILYEFGNVCATLEGAKLCVIHQDTAVAHYDVSDWLKLEALPKAEVKQPEKAIEITAISPFKDKKMLFTGTLTVPRKEAEAKAVEVGATILSGVSKKLDYLIVGEDAGSKLDKAKRIGVTVLNEPEFWTMLVPKKEGVSFSLPEKTLNAKDLLVFLKTADWSVFDSEKDAEALRDLLLQLEKTEGLQEVHQYCSEQLLALVQDSKWPFFKLQHRFGHLHELVAYGLSPDGKYLATGSWVGDDYYAGGELMIWEVATGRCVNNLDEVEGGVGWPDYSGCLKWSPDGKLLGLAMDTNGVGVCKPFSDSFITEELAYLTDGWSRPPQWCWHPEGKALYISCWNRDYFLPGYVLPLDRKAFPLARPYGFNVLPKTLFSEEDIEGSDIMQNDETGEESPLEVMHKPGWSSQGAIFGNDSSFAFTQDPMDRSVIAVMKKVSDAATWSPDGSYYLYPIGRSIEVYNLAFKQLCVLELGTAVLQEASAKKEGVKFNKIDRICWHPNEELNLFAAIVYGEKGFAAIYKDFNFIGFIKTAILEIGRWDMGDVETFVFSKDATKIATLSPDRTVRIWELAEFTELKHFKVFDATKGILLAVDDRLIAINQEKVAFYDSKTGEMSSHFQVGLSNGDPTPALSYAPLGRFADRFALNPYFPIADNEDILWIGAFQSGLVVTDNSVTAEKLDEELCYTIGNRIAWPYRWVKENRVADLEEALQHPSFPFPETTKKQIARSLVAEKEKKTDPKDYFMSLTKKQLFGKKTKKNGYIFSDNSGDFWDSTKEMMQVNSIELGIKTADHYKLSEKLTGEAINYESIKKMLGKVVLYVQGYSPTRVQIGTLIQVSEDSCYMHHIEFNEDKKQGSSGGGSASFSDLIYIGLALPR